MRQSTIVFNSMELEWERPAGMTVHSADYCGNKTAGADHVYFIDLRLLLCLDALLHSSDDLTTLALGVCTAVSDRC